MAAARAAPYGKEKARERALSEMNLQLLGNQRRQTE
jgi:hypothetical protein